jgi:hypothetical protein
LSNFDHSNPNVQLHSAALYDPAAEEMVIALVEANDPASAGLEPAIAGSSCQRVVLFIENFDAAID